MVQICVNCGSETPMGVYVKYYRDSDNKIHIGGSQVQGPICQPCFWNISDAASSGKPSLIKYEHEQVKRIKNGKN